MSEYRQILKDEKLNEQLRERGYVTVPFLNKDEVDSLIKVFYDNHKSDINHFYATAHVDDLDFRERMNQEIRKVYNRAIGEYFINCRPLGGSYIVKPVGQQGLLQPHQDWSIVDENYFRSYNIWIPLVDLNEQNGTIYVLPCSHKWVDAKYRHSSIDCVYGKVYDLVWKSMTPLYLKAGEALIYDHAMVHASQANETKDLRLACAYGIIPEEAEMRYYWNNNGQVEEYASNPTYFMTQNIFSGPKGLTKLADVAYDFHQVTTDEFCELAGIEKPVELIYINAMSQTVKVDSEHTESFWKIYTPMNILREIKGRLISK